MHELPLFQIIRSHRKSISIHISRQGEVTVRAPHLTPTFFINRFVKEKSDWIEKQLNLVKYQKSDEYLYLGSPYKLHVGNFKEISVTDTLNFPAFQHFRLQKELHQWYKAQAKKIITRRVLHYADELQTTYKSISYSDTTSKWGSCSRDNHLQFTWRLIMAPILVIDYVVVHELIHTKEKNHGTKFWKKVEKYKPAYKQYKKWLREHAHAIHAV